MELGYVGSPHFARRTAGSVLPVRPVLLKHPLGHIVPPEILGLDVAEHGGRSSGGATGASGRRGRRRFSPPAVSRPRRSEWPEKRSASSPASAAACLTSRATALSDRRSPVTRPALVTAQNSGRSARGRGWRSSRGRGRCGGGASQASSAAAGQKPGSAGLAQTATPDPGPAGRSSSGGQQPAARGRGRSRRRPG